MRFVVQRVKHAEVAADGATVGSIGRGFLVLIGVSAEDIRSSGGGKETASKMVRKLAGLRIFEDENGKTNLDLKAVGGALLLVSQFTLYADCRRGNRPSFINAGSPAQAGELYEYIIGLCRQEVPVVETGVFGAEMEVSLLNDGPFTVILDSAEIC